MQDPKASEWFRRTPLRANETCGPNGHCKDCRPSGGCDVCGTIDGRWVEAVNRYASTCDNCGELTMHESMAMDPQTQLGYCAACVPKLSAEIRARFSQSD